MVIISICENDDNGCLSGYVDAIEIRNDELHFEAIEPQSVEFKYFGENNQIVFDGVFYPGKVLSYWCGNMSWNAYQMQEGYFLAFINHVIRSRKFMLCHYENENIPDKMDNGENITAKDFPWMDNDIIELTYNERQLSLF